MLCPVDWIQSRLLLLHFREPVQLPSWLRWVKNTPAMWEMWVQPLGWEDPLKRAWQPIPVYLPGEFPWTEEPGGLQSMGSQSVGHD